MAAPVVVAKAAKVVASLLTTEEGRGAIKKVVVVLLSPIIAVLVILFAFLQGGSKHNTDMVYLCFYGGDPPAYAPAEFGEYVRDMQASFTLLDAEIGKVDEQAEDASLDAVQIKSVFFSLYFGLESLSRRDHKAFVKCFYTLEEREREVEVPNPDYDPEDEDSPETITVTETYEVAVPIHDLETVYANIAASLGITATPEQKANAAAIYSLISGSGGWDGSDYPFMPNPGGFICPLPGIDWRSHVSSEFGTRADNHRGIDITAPYGTPILAMKDGVVTAASPWVNSWGIYVSINHGDGVTTLYAHMSRLAVSSGQVVKQGDVIGYVGMTGNTDGPHLHLEVTNGGKLVNPRTILP